VYPVYRQLSRYGAPEQNIRATQKVRLAFWRRQEGQFRTNEAMDGHLVWLFRRVRRLVNKIRNHLTATIITQQKPVRFFPQPHEAGG
jgi:hypothetical protein